MSERMHYEMWGNGRHAFPLVEPFVGDGPVDAAFLMASKRKPPRRAVELYADDPSTLLLAALCRELQRQAGDGDFALDARTAARLIGVPSTLHSWRKLFILCIDGIVERTEKGTGRRSSRYRYIGDRTG